MQSSGRLSINYRQIQICLTTKLQSMKKIPSPNQDFVVIIKLSMAIMLQND